MTQLYVQVGHNDATIKADRLLTKYRGMECELFVAVAAKYNLDLARIMAMVVSHPKRYNYPLQSCRVLSEPLETPD